jgi:hypothetical protein
MTSFIANFPRGTVVDEHSRRGGYSWVVRNATFSPVSTVLVTTDRVLRWLLERTDSGLMTRVTDENGVVTKRRKDCG